MDKNIKKNFLTMVICLGIYALYLVIRYKIFGIQLSEGELLFLTWLVVFLFILPIAHKIGFKISKKYKSIRALNKDDLGINKDYYRDLLKMNTPLILGFIDSIKLDTNVFVAELLYLEYVNAIIIKDGKIEKNPAFYGPLLSSEKFLLSKIENGSIKIENKEMFITMLKLRIKDDAARKVWNGEGLVTDRKNRLYSLKNLIIKAVLICILLEFLSFLEAYFILLVVLIVLAVISGALNEKFGLKSMYDMTNCKRTKEGEALNKKLEGLKRFLKEYSMLEEKEREDLIVWNEYLIYSVLFGQNKKIANEYKKYIQY